MTTVQIIITIGIQALAAGLGLYALVLLLQKARNQTVIALHLLAGLGGVEILIGILHVSDFDADSPVRALGMLAAKIFGVALAAGALIPLFGKGRPQLVNLLLTVHVGAALAAFVTTLMFVRQV
jgi:hypothetical protein